MPRYPSLPPVANQPLSVLLLATEPGPQDEAILTRWRDFLEARAQPYELLVVEDSRGQGAALRSALAQARHPLLFYTLLHPAYRPEYLGQLLERPFQAEDPSDAPPGKEIDHVHLMSGYRAGVKMPLFLRLLGWTWRMFWRILLSDPQPPLPGWLGWRRHLAGLLSRFFFGLRYHDVACPFRLLRRDILARIPLQSDSSFAHVELLAKANFLGCLMGEELPLDIPPGPYRGDGAAILKDARTVFNRPDFGPTVLTEPPPPETPVVT